MVESCHGKQKDSFTIEVLFLGSVKKWPKAMLQSSRETKRQFKKKEKKEKKKERQFYKQGLISWVGKEVAENDAPVNTGNRKTVYNQGLVSWVGKNLAMLVFLSQKTQLYSRVVRFMAW